MEYSSQVLLNGRRFLQNRRTAILGISPGNPHYYKDHELNRLFHFGKQNSDKLMLFVPDKISEHNHRAVGSPNPQRSAEAKARRLRKKCSDVFRSNGLSDTPYSFIRWEEDVETCPAYNEALQQVRDLYETNEAFRSDIREPTQGALRCLKNHREKGMRGKDGDITPASNPMDVEEGVNYLLKELAFFAAVPMAYDSCDQFVLIYHRSWPVLEKFFDGHYDGIRRPCLGFVVFE